MSPRERTINLLTFQAANAVSLAVMLTYGAEWPMLTIFSLSIVFMVGLEIYVGYLRMEDEFRKGPFCPTCRRSVYE